MRRSALLPLVALAGCDLIIPHEGGGKDEPESCLSASDGWEVAAAVEADGNDWPVFGASLAIDAQDVPWVLASREVFSGEAWTHSEAVLYTLDGDLLREAATFPGIVDDTTGTVWSASVLNTLAYDAEEDVFWTGGALVAHPNSTDTSGYRPLALRYRPSADQWDAFVLSEGTGFVYSAAISSDGVWFGGDSSTGYSHSAALWRIDGDGEILSFSWQPDGSDEDTFASFSSLAPHPDGGVLAGGGVIWHPTDELAFLFHGTDAGMTELLRLDRSETDGASGSFYALDTSVDGELMLAWGVDHNIPLEDRSWILYEAPLSDPSSLAPIDTEEGDDDGRPLTLLRHTSGLDFAGGFLSGDDGRFGPAVRVREGGAWRESLAADPGFGDFASLYALAEDSAGRVYGLADYSTWGEPGAHTRFELLTLPCE